MHINFAWLSLAGPLLLACNNPAPRDDADAAGASAALDGPGHACQLAQHVAAASSEQGRGLYASTDSEALASTYTGSELPCGDALNGSYGVHVELDVYVQDDASSSEHDPGRGRASVLLRADIARAPDGASADVTLQLCGLELPARYAYASSGVTALALPQEIFDRESMPRWKAQLHSAASDDALQLDAFPMLLGIALSEPGAAWPRFDQTPAFDCGSMNCFPDHDGDGEPGLSFHTHGAADLEDAPYPACADWQSRGPSTDNHVWSANIDSEASRVFVGLRTALQLFPRFDAACDQANGRARAADIVTRAIDCELSDGQRCSPSQATVIDQRSPTFHVLEAGETPPETFRDSRHFVDEALDRSASQGGQVTLQRLTDAAANCEAVRATFAI
jgi:hypothetical protein